MTTVAVICGSLRKESYNKKLVQLMKDSALGQMKLVEVSIEQIPLYNFDVEVEGIPDSVESFKQQISQADGVIIVTPEYNSGMPGVLKNALDWGSRPPKSSPFTNKPIAVAGATPGGVGTALAQAQLRQTLVAMNAHVMVTPKVLVSHVQTKLAENKEKIDDTRTNDHIVKYLDAFEQWIELFTK